MSIAFRDLLSAIRWRFLAVTWTLALAATALLVVVEASSGVAAIVFGALCGGIAARAVGDRDGWAFLPATLGMAPSCAREHRSHRPDVRSSELLHFGFMQEEAGQLEDAERTYRKVMADGPAREAAGAASALADLLARQGRDDEARDVLSRTGV